MRTARVSEETAVLTYEKEGMIPLLLRRRRISRYLYEYLPRNTKRLKSPLTPQSSERNVWKVRERDSSRLGYLFYLRFPISEELYRSPGAILRYQSTFRYRRNINLRNQDFCRRYLLPPFTGSWIVPPFTPSLRGCHFKAFFES